MQWAHLTQMSAYEKSIMEVLVILDVEPYQLMLKSFPSM